MSERAKTLSEQAGELRQLAATHGSPAMCACLIGLAEQCEWGVSARRQPLNRSAE
jgi:hypothetical protein